MSTTDGAAPQAGRTLEQMDYYFAKYQQWDIHRVAYQQAERADTIIEVEMHKDDEHGEVEVREVA